MADFTPVFQAAGAQFNVDPTILQAIAMKESSMNPAAVNPASGATGLMQFTPANAKAYGIDPRDPQQSIFGAAQMFRENLDRFGGNVDQAVAAHFAGPDQKLWGPKTGQYVDQVSGIFNSLRRGSPTGAQPQASNQPDGSDPLLSMAQGMAKGNQSAPAAPAPSASSGDPLLDMAQGIATAKAPAPAATPAAPAMTPAGNVATGAVMKADGSPVAPNVAPPAQPMLPVRTAPQANAQDLAMGGASPDTWNQLQQIGSGAAHGIGSMVNNAANLVEKGVASGLGAIPGVRDTALARAAAQTANSDVATQAAADQQFRQTASPGAQAAGFVAPMLVPVGGVMKAGNAIKSGVTALPMMGGTVGRLIGSGLGNAATGAALSTGAPIDPSQDYWSQVAHNTMLGAGLGVGIPAAAGAVGGTAKALFNVAKPLLNPRAYVGEGLANAVGNDAGQVASSIRSAPQFVPGSMPTTAQVAPTPTLVATEKAAANNVPGFKIAQAEWENANNQARWDTLGQVAGSPLDLANALAARDTAAAPLYNVAKQQTLTVDAPLSGLLSRPAMQTAVKRAQTLADNNNAGPIMQSSRVPNPMGGSPTSMTTMTGNGAQAIKEALDAMLLPENTQKLSGKEIGALQDTRNGYLAWLESKSPEFRQARQTYAGMSPPINTMQAAQQVADGLSGMGKALNSSGTPQMTAPGYASALSQALRQQEFGIDPAAQQTLENIGHDLQRSTVSNSLRSPGSDTAYNVTANGWLANKLYGKTFQGGGVGKALGGAAQAAGAAGGAALFGPAGAGVGSAVGSGMGAVLNGSRVGNRLNQHLSDLLLNPQDLLPYLDARAAGPISSKAQALAHALSQRLQFVPALVAPQVNR